MPKVENLTSRGISLARWRLLPNGSAVISPSGQPAAELPAEVAYSSRAKAMADQGLIAIPGYTVGQPKAAKIIIRTEPKVKAEVKVEAVVEETPAGAVTDQEVKEVVDPPAPRKFRKKDRK